MCFGSQLRYHSRGAYSEPFYVTKAVVSNNEKLESSFQARLADEKYAYNDEQKPVEEFHKHAPIRLS